MARIRSIKPEFWTDSFMVQLPPLARLIYIALWTAADDHGLIPDEPERLAMEVMPKEDALVFDDWFQFFEASGRIELLAVEGSTYYRIAKWEAHQRVDKPSKSRISREGSRKVAIPLGVRRKVAEKYGCAPGERVDAQCYYCGAFGQVHWHKLSSGRPSGWVTFPGLELDHLQAESEGGETAAENFVLACRSCNRSKGTKHWIDYLCDVNSASISPFLPSPREGSSTERKGTGNREGEQGRGTGNRDSSLRSDSSPSLTLDGDPSPPADLKARKAARIHQIATEAQDAYNSILGKPNGLLTACTVLNRPRMKAVEKSLPTARIICQQIYGNERITQQFWQDYFREVKSDDFHSGRGPYKPPHEHWRPDFEFLLREDVMAKLFDRAQSAASSEHAA